MSDRIAGWKHDLRALQQQVGRLKNMIEEEQEKIVREDLGPECPEFISIDQLFRCRPSPVGTCVYDNTEDPCHDECLYCGEPYERK